MRSKDRLNKLEEKQRALDNPLVVILGASPLPVEEPTEGDIAQWVAEGRAVSQNGGRVIVYDDRREPMTVDEWHVKHEGLQ